MKVYVAIIMVFCVICGANLTSGCKSNASTLEKNQQQYMLKSQALDKPMFEILGTNITILIVGTEQNPAVFRVYNPEIAATIANEQPQTWYTGAGNFLGGIIGGLYSGASTDSVLSASSNETETVVAPSNTVMVYSTPIKETPEK